MTIEPSSALNGRNARVKTKVTDEIIEALRQDIVNGRLVRGQRMPSEKQLADNYGVSQPTIREVMRALEMIGLISIQHGSGTYVTGSGTYALSLGLLTLLQLEDVGVLDVQIARCVISPESAALAAKNASPSQLNVIQEAIAKLDEPLKNKNHFEYLQRVLEFQSAMSIATNSVLIYALEMFLADLMFKLQAEVIKPSNFSAWLKRGLKLQPLRRAIFDAIAAKDPEQAREASRNYMGSVLKAFKADAKLGGARILDPAFAEAMKDVARNLQKIQ